MAFCTNCGSPLDAGHKFCTNCGQSNPNYTPVPAPGSQPAVSDNRPYSAPPAEEQTYYSGSRDPQPEPSFSSSYNPAYGAGSSGTFSDAGYTQPPKKKKGLSGGAVAAIIIVAVLIALIAVVVVLLMNGKDKQKEEPIFTQPILPVSSEAPDEQPQASAAFRQSIAGHYQVVSLKNGDSFFDRDMLITGGYGDVSLDFYSDGTGYFNMPDEEPMKFTYSESKLFFGLGDVSDFLFEDGVVTVTDEDVTFVFSADGTAPAAPAAPAATQAPAASDQLPLESDWHGTLTISNHSGSDTLSDGPMEVWGFLGSDSEGNVFFELYEDEYGASGHAILSMYVDVQGDHFVPIIGEDDAWIFNAQLDQRDVAPFTLYYRNGSLTLDSYSYRIQGESCTISFTVSPY